MQKTIKKSDDFLVLGNYSQATRKFYVGAVRNFYKWCMQHVNDPDFDKPNAHRRYTATKAGKRHILPPGFQKVRYYGIPASAGRKKLRAIQAELKVELPTRRSTAQIVEKLIGSPIDICQNCGAIGQFVTIGIASNEYWIFDNCSNISQRCRPPPRLGATTARINPLSA